MPATLLKRDFNIVFSCEISCVFSEHLLLETPLDGCVCSFVTDPPYQDAVTFGLEQND